MKTCCLLFLVLIFLTALFSDCSKPIETEVQKPRLFITLKDDSGRSVSAATVRLYKNLTDTGITKISDTAGVVIFSELDTLIYYWLAEKACLTNRVSQVTLGRPLIPGVVLYGYSVMSKTGTIKIINNSPETYKVSDTLFSTTINKDTPYIAYHKVGSYLTHSAKLSTPEVVKDTLITIQCGATTVLNLPY